MANEETKKYGYAPAEEEDDERYACKKCKDTGKILGKQGIHICYDCLQAGRLDVHSKEIKDTNIRW